jgi:Concanavalin A-like lectin/glucanases superfamily
MSAEPRDHELSRLFAAKADGSITPEEHELLSAALKESAEARREWFAFQDAEAGLLAWAQREALRREEPAIDWSGRTETRSEENTHGLGKATEPNRTRRNAGRAETLRWGGLKYIGTLAAGIAIGVGAWAMRPRSMDRAEHSVDRAERSGSNAIAHNEAATSSVAVLTRGVNMVWDRAGAAPVVNAPLSPGLLRLKSGVVEIEFYQGARLCVEGPAEVRLVSAGEAFCSYGRFSAHVPPPARGFRIGTPKGDVVDLGTDFGLDLSGGSPELHVFKGEVELHQPKTQMRKLTGGFATALDQPAGAPSLLADASAFAFSHELGARVNAAQRQSFERWQEAGARWNDDPDLRMRFDFQEENGARSLRNAAVRGQEIASGTIVGCAWTEGRWPGKRALQFGSVSDRVRLSIPYEFPQLTMAAWVQLHSVNPGRSSLFMCEGWEYGGMHWQILHDGSLCLGIAGETHKGGDDYISPVIFTPDFLGQWVHLAVVYDTAGGEVRHYVNGECVSRHPVKNRTVITPRLAELGNWNPVLAEWRQRPVRNFVGSMDDFSLVARAMTDGEIRTLAQ